MGYRYLGIQFLCYFFFYSALLQNPCKHPTEASTLVKQHYLKKTDKKGLLKLLLLLFFPTSTKNFSLEQEDAFLIFKNDYWNHEFKYREANLDLHEGTPEYDLIVKTKNGGAI